MGFTRAKGYLCACAVLVYGLTNTAYSAPVNLSSWKVDGGGNWSLHSGSAPNDSATQSLNSAVTMLFNDTNSQGMSLSGSIKVETTSDNDFIGFVLGYHDGDFDGSSMTPIDYILVDWKQGTQSGWDAGMAISRVTGPISAGGSATGSDAWQHTGNISFIQRAATLGNVGWVDNTEYLFDIDFTATNIKVSVNGVQQFNINGTFADGSFGFYNYSQPNVRYAGIEEDVVPMGVPEPSTFALCTLGVLGLIGYRRRSRRTA